MFLGKLFGTAAVLLAATALAGVGGSEETNLTGGTVPPVVSLPPYPGVVNLLSSVNRCTASKVGARRFLLAAHCVFDFSQNRMLPAYADNATISVTNLPHPFSGIPWVSLTIQHTHANPAFLSACSAAPCSYDGMIQQAADVALIIVKEDTPLITQAYVNFGTLGQGTAIDIMGYGCEAGRTGPGGVPGDPSLPWGRLKYHSTRVQAPSILSNLGLPVTSPLQNHHFFTAGKALDATEASLCPGDSGGPIFLGDGQRAYVVGVNGAQTSWDSTETSVVNIHAKLSTVQTWLQPLL